MTRFRSSILLLGVGLAFTAIACDSDDSPTAAADESLSISPDLTTVDGLGNTSLGAGDVGAMLEALPVSRPTAVETEGLLFMREEEKLAQDVYTALHAQWGTRVFQNIARSEATHTEAVRALLERYGIEDPAMAEAGTFRNESLQSLHDALVERGSQSLEEALRVGAAIEEIDILDLIEQLKETNSPEIALVYENLYKGSRNHLRSFSSQITSRTGQPYEPEYLPAELYDRIVSAPMERGGN